MTVASRRAIPFIVGMALAVPLACGAIREDEFQCENAVAHLKACCPVFNAMGVACNYGTGCGVTVYPVLDVQQSKCIERESCDTIRKTGLCEAVAALSDLPGSDAAGSGPTVCPMALQAAPPASDNDVEPGTIACASMIDCQAGQVCCAGLVGSATLTSCLAPPCPPFSSDQLCATSAECRAGETCQSPPAGFGITGLTVCASASVGSTDAAEEVRDGDRPPADATGATDASNAADAADTGAASDATVEGTTFADASLADGAGE
jgi:hypothetical protein